MYLCNKIGKKGLALIVAHSEISLVGEHLKQNLKEFEAFHVDRRVGVEESKCYPA